ncbi:MAG: aldehyde dehydrogenase family protein, partial [Pseudonocardiaceae bacterium]
MSVSDRERAVAGAAPAELFINGQWRPSSSGKTFDVEDPSTGKVLGAVADATAEDGMAALDAAVGAQAGWAQSPPRERGEILRRAYELMMRRQEDLALLMTLEMGKPLAESRGEIAYAAEFFRWFGEEAVRIDGGFATAPQGSGRVLVMRQPVGPSLL